MARRGRKNQANGLGAIILLLIGGVTVAVEALVEFVSENIVPILLITAVILIGVIIGVIIKIVVNRQRKVLLDEILAELHLENIDSILKEYDDQIIVKSRQTLENYTDIKYFKEKNVFDIVKNIVLSKNTINNTLNLFLQDNKYVERKQYKYVREQLVQYIQLAEGYNVLLTYVTSAGNNKGNSVLHISSARINELNSHPEYLMGKGEYNKLQKEKNKEQLEKKKHDMYSRVNTIIDRGNNSKDKLIIKSNSQKMDDLITKLFDRTVNSIQKIKDINSEEWGLIDTVINSVDNDTKAILEEENQLCSYYNSESFIKLKETCDKLIQSQKDFNEYIEEKANSISQLFGTRVVRNETQNEDVYNYLRAYKKSITPFTAEVSSTVFSSAENDPIGYVIKYFYPNKTQYKEQVEKLRVLISELETLKEAKIIIDNYKKDYSEYIKDVPSYVLEKDESGFYSRLGFAVIDESVLAIEYKFSYTSDGGMAHRSFTIPMSEENIVELINQLESKLSLSELAKEQRALMTTKLRQAIKERDHFTCCQCGNTTQQEPNLLLEIDHIIPVAKGGLTREDNLQTLCWKCNRSKGAKIMA